MSNHRVIANRLALCVVLVVSFSPRLAAQLVISAAPGLIQYAEGGVLVDGSTLVYDPTQFVHLRLGQRLRTERGRVELMLVPDTLVRVDANSEVEMVEAQLTAAHLRLLSGTCTVEIRNMFADSVAELIVGDASVRFHKNGLYRLLYRPGNLPRLQVFRGEAIVSRDGVRQKVRSNRSARWSPDGDESELAKLDQYDLASLDDWSRTGDTAQRLFTVGQSDAAEAAVISARLYCGSGRECRVTGLDCVMQARARRQSFSFSGGPHLSLFQSP